MPATTQFDILAIVARGAVDAQTMATELKVDIDDVQSHLQRCRQRCHVITNGRVKSEAGMWRRLYTITGLGRALLDAYVASQLQRTTIGVDVRPLVASALESRHDLEVAWHAVAAQAR